MKADSSHYLATMFAMCMLFMTLYVFCVILWMLWPELAGHFMLVALFPGFKLLDMVNFVYGLVMSGIYGVIIAALYVFFHNLWPKVANTVLKNRS